MSLGIFDFVDLFDWMQCLGSHDLDVHLSLIWIKRTPR